MTGYETRMNRYRTRYFSFQCGCWTISMIISFFLGAFSVNYLLNIFLEKTIPFFFAGLVGLLSAEISVPVALIVCILKYFEVF